MVLVPGGAMGVLLKSKFPNSDAYADSDGLHLDDLNTFNVMLHWGRSRYYSLDGSCGSQVYNPAMI